MRKNFETKLDELNRDIVDMGQMVNHSLQMALEALLRQDGAAAKEVVNQENAIDELASHIEQEALLLLLKEAPLARDFRFVSAVIRMNTDIERIGDQAEDIAELVKQMIAYGYEPRELGSINKMATITQEMVSKAITAFIDGDLALATEAGDMDDQVDQLFTEVREEVIDEIRAEEIDPHLIIDLMMIAKYLERSADHAQNIAESVVYALTGEFGKFH